MIARPRPASPPRTKPLSPAAAAAAARAGAWNPWWDKPDLSGSPVR